MVDWLVQDSTEHDPVEVQAIYGHHVLHGTASFEEEPPPVVELRRRRAEVLTHDFPYLVATDRSDERRPPAEVDAHAPPGQG